MKESLLELLEKEKKLIWDIAYCNASVQEWEKKAQNPEEDEMRKASCISLAKDRRDMQARAEENLLEVRQRIKVYIKELMDL